MQRLHFDTKLDLVMVENKPKFFTVFISCKQKYTVSIWYSVTLSNKWKLTASKQELTASEPWVELTATKPEWN